MNLLVGTRKGLFTFTREAAGWQAVSETFLGDPIPMLMADRRDGSWYAAVEHGHFGTKLHRSDDLGKQWVELDAPRYPAKPDDVADTMCPMRQIPIPWSLEKIWTIESGGADKPGVLWCGTIPGGLFKSSDRGETWELNRPLWDMPERAKWCGGGYDYPGIHSIGVNPENSDDLVLGVSCGGVWRTLDGGQHWHQAAHGMFYDFDPDQPEDNPDAQDPHYVARCAAQPEQMWSQHHCGIFRWQPDEKRWNRMEGVQPSAFGFAVAVHPADPNTAWFVPAVKDEWRYPVDGKLVVNRTRNGGISFESLSSGLPEGKAYDLIYRHGLAVDDSGTTLAMGSTTGALWISDSGGDQWELLSAHLPPVYCVRFDR